jgi:hypothetical protein
MIWILGIYFISGIVVSSYIQYHDGESLREWRNTFKTPIMTLGAKLFCRIPLWILGLMLIGLTTLIWPYVIMLFVRDALRHHEQDRQRDIAERKAGGIEL